MNSGSGLISEDDTEGFNVIGSSFINFVDSKNLTLSSFSFKLSSKVIPKLRFSDYFVGSE